MTKTVFRNLPVLVLTLVTAALGMAADVHFGPVQIAAFENARLTAYCDGSVTPTPGATQTCEITFEFESLDGRIFKQATMTIDAGKAGFLDLSAAETRLGGPVQINPCWKVTRGSARASLQVFDTFSLRTRILINWGDRSVPRSGDVDFGLAGITAPDTARLSATCSDDPVVGRLQPPPCDIAFEFHDAQGGLLKQTRMTLQPGTAGFADLRFAETHATTRRVEIEPCWNWKVAGGSAVGTFSVIDNLTGLTLAHAYPAALASATATP